MLIEDSAFEGGNQRILRFDDRASGTRGLIVVDSTVLGPAMGGCRLWRYPSDSVAELDARRLARSMSLKNAMAGLPFGGGQSVLQAPEGPFDRKALLEAFAHAVNVFAGSYLTAEDVGTTEEDMKVIRSASPHVLGLPVEYGVAGGDPSPWAALGVFGSIETLVHRSGRELHRSRVAIQGLGRVAFNLCLMLHEAGVELVASDVRDVAIQRMAARGLPVRIVSPDEIHKVNATVFAPCALGASLNLRTIEELGAEMVIGSANNQLATPADGERLFRRGILYAPDYVVNAGGVINIAAEYLHESLRSVQRRVECIPPRVLSIVERAEAEGAPTSLLADDMAREVIRAG